MQFRFADHVLDVERRELRRRGEPIALEPQVFDLLVYLIRNRDRVVTKDDLLASVWGGRIVSESTLTSRINAARKAVGDSGEAQRLIRTVAPQGYPLRRGGDRTTSRRRHRRPRPQDRPSIAVLPFDNLSGDREQEYFADGIVAGDHHRTVADQMAVRHLAQFDLHLQGQAGRREDRRPGTGRALRARRQRAPVRRPCARDRAADRDRDRRPRLGRSVRRHAR